LDGRKSICSSVSPLSRPLIATSELMEPASSLLNFSRVLVEVSA
jgi:hypothetical protein